MLTYPKKFSPFLIVCPTISQPFLLADNCLSRFRTNFVHYYLVSSTKKCRVPPRSSIAVDRRDNIKRSLFLSRFVANVLLICLFSASHRVRNKANRGKQNTIIIWRLPPFSSINSMPEWTVILEREERSVRLFIVSLNLLRRSLSGDQWYWNSINSWNWRSGFLDGLCGDFLQLLQCIEISLLVRSTFSFQRSSMIRVVRLVCNWMQLLPRPANEHSNWSSKSFPLAVNNSWVILLRLSTKLAFVGSLEYAPSETAFICLIDSMH